MSSVQQAPPLTPRRPTKAQDAIRLKAQTAFLSAYEQIGTITHAADAVGIDRQSHYNWLAEDEDYAARWAMSQQAGDEALLKEAIRRGKDGVEQGVYYQGVRVDTELKYSDNLLMFMIKGRMPQYRDRYEVSGPQGGPIQVAAMRPDALSRLSDAQLDALAALNGPVAALTAGAKASQAPDIDAEVVPETPLETESESPDEK